MIDIFSFWKVGKFLREKEGSCSNIQRACSCFLSYYYGNSYQFSLLHIHMMKKLYSYFPVFLDPMQYIHWNSYLELLKLDPEECYFYYHILLFCGDNYDELKNLIQNKIYLRI
ncbi:MAG: hypothetical protein J6X28_04765 [Bacilli bacterium]|nr:hypothetical protein [Bacilli bacterium]